MDGVQTETEVKGKRYILLDNDIADLVEQFSPVCLRIVLPVLLRADKESKCGCRSLSDRYPI